MHVMVICNSRYQMGGVITMSIDSNREKILNAALDLFSSQGYDGTSVDEVAAKCGMKAPKGEE